MSMSIPIHGTEVIAALKFSAKRHRDQRRKDQDASPYINHPIDVLHVLVCEAEVSNHSAILAAILHDTIEDTCTTQEELTDLVGPFAAAIVAEVSDDRTLPKVQRKRLQVEHAPHLSYPARLVKLADKICNLRDMAFSPPVDWSLERRIEYFDWSKEVVDGMRGTHEVLEALFDMAYSMKPQA